MDNQAGTTGNCWHGPSHFHDRFLYPFWDCDGNFSLLITIASIFHYFAWIQMIRFWWAVFIFTYVRARRCERYDILLELLDTSKEERSDKILDLCFSYIESPRFQTDELLGHVEDKFLLGEESADDPVIRAMKKAENEPKRSDQRRDVWKGFADYMRMRINFRLFAPRYNQASYEVVKEIIDRAREERAGIGRGEDWLATWTFNEDLKRQLDPRGLKTRDRDKED